jgi:hypothetical protein
MDMEKCALDYTEEIRNKFIEGLGVEREKVTVKYNCSFDGEFKDNIILRHYYNDSENFVDIEFNTYTYDVFFEEIVNLIKDICKQSYKDFKEIKKSFSKLIDTKYTKLANAQLLEKDFFKLNLVDYLNLN